MAEMRALRLAPEQFRYHALIGTGGIGSGSFFAIRGNETLGREESRGGRFLDRRDYCKLHIIAHYVSTLLGPAFATIPIGRVGDDPVGHKLLSEMARTGFDTRFVKMSPDHSTLYSFCFIYPDGSGGNLTTDDSACGSMDEAAVVEAEGEFQRHRGAGIALAAPEVPLPARAALLRLGRKHAFFNVAAFNSEEIIPAFEQGLLEDVDLVALNRHEAATIARMPAEDCRPEAIVQSALSALRSRCPRIRVSLTAGTGGSCICEEDRLVHRPAIPAEVRSTAGAGDAHLAGLIIGIVAGLPLARALEFAALLASFKITSPHTIHPDVSRAALRGFAERSSVTLSPEIRDLLEDGP